MQRRHVIGLLLTLVTWVSVPALSHAQLPSTHPGPIPSRATVPLGAAVWWACLDQDSPGPPPLDCPRSPDPRYAAAVEERFDSITPENEFKMLWTQPSPDRFDFSVSDRIVDWAERQRKPVRGHTLVYAGSNAWWVDHPTTPWTRASLLDVMQTRIATMVGRYRGRVASWDVVNEPFTDAGVRDANVYERTIGPDWVEQAFRAAHQADPEALLFLNEFNADVVGPRQRAVLALVDDFVRRGVPIDGVGLQMHVGSDGTYPTAEQLGEVMAQYARLGLRVEVTEADALRPREPERSEGLAQTEAFDAVARACAAAPNCTGMTVWGVGDAYSWRSAAQRATLLDGELMPKSAYALVRCRLAAPAAADGAVTDPGGCAPPAEAPPPPAAPQPPAAPTQTRAPTAEGPTPVAPAPQPRIAPKRSFATERRPSVRLVHTRLGRRGLARGIAVRVAGAQPGARVSVRIRRGRQLLARATVRAGARGAARPVVHLPARVRRALRPRSRLRVTVAFSSATGARTVRRFVVTVV